MTHLLDTSALLAHYLAEPGATRVQRLFEDWGRIRCGTMKCDNGSLQIEDFVAIPDLIAGALSEQFRSSLSAALWDKL
jgi:hypothetical protein